MGSGSRDEIALSSGDYSAASAVMAACRRRLNRTAIAGSALSNGISAKQRSWKRTSCCKTIFSIRSRNTTA